MKLIQNIRSLTPKWKLELGKILGTVATLCGYLAIQYPERAKELGIATMISGLLAGYFATGKLKLKDIQNMTPEGKQMTLARLVNKKNPTDHDNCLKDHLLDDGYKTESV